MLLHETYGKLTSQLTFEYYNNQPTEKFAEKYRIFAPMAVSFTEDRVKSYYYLPEEVESDREQMIFLRQFEARKKLGIWTIYFNSTFYTDLLTLKPFMEIPSVIIDDIQLINGRHYFHLRFNREYTRQISELVISLVSEGDEYQVLNFGDNPGLNSLIDIRGLNHNRDLRFLRVIVENYTEPEYDGFRIPEGTVREYKTHAGINTGRAIYYFPEGFDGGSPPEGFVRISDTMNHYEGPAKSSLTDFLSTYENRIPLHSVSRIQEIKGNSLVTEYLMTDWALEILLRRINEARNEFPDVSIHIDYASEIMDAEAISIS